MEQKTNETVSTRRLALKWWNDESNLLNRTALFDRYFSNTATKDKMFTVANNYKELTGREIEEIWLKETQEQQYSLYDSNMKHTEDCGKIIVRESKPNKETSTKEQASKWFSSKSYLEQHSLSDKYFESKNPSLLTIEQVLEIYDKEILEPKRQKEWQESQVNRRYSKPNQKQINSTYCSNKNCVGGVITFDGQTGRLCKKCNPVNTKQFKQFDESLFKAYISEFSDEDKLKMWDWLTSELSNTVVKTRFEKMLKQLY